jgi:TetR/AcrR family transcriptional regulator, lmrAB and yxaGH operons repressor
MMPADTRTRMIEATVQALQRCGVAGMSFTDVLRASGAARGAIYHHFPGGKTQLVAEAAARNGLDVRAHLAALPADSPQAVVEAFLAAVRPVVEASAGGGGCAVAAITVGAGAGDDTLRQVAATAFASWTGQLAEQLTTAGLTPGEAGDLAALLIGLLEGAHIMCRAEGTLQPFDRAARAATALTRSRPPGQPAPQPPAATPAP